MKQGNLVRFAMAPTTSTLHHRPLRSHSKTNILQYNNLLIFYLTIRGQMLTSLLDRSMSPIYRKFFASSHPLLHLKGALQCTSYWPLAFGHCFACRSARLFGDTLEGASVSLTLRRSVMTRISSCHPLPYPGIFY